MRKQIPLIAIAVFAIVILLSQTFYIQPAYAQSFGVITGFAQPIKAMHYQSTTDLIWLLAEGSGFTWLYGIDRSTQSVIITTNLTAQVDAISAGVTQDIWCGKTDCYISAWVSGGAGTIMRVSSVDISPNIFAGKNITGSVASSTGGGISHLAGRDEVTGGFGSVTIWADTCDAAACATARVYIYDGISLTVTGSLPLVNSGASIRVHELRWSGVSGITDNDLVSVHGSNVPNVAANHLVVYNLATLAVKCDVQLPLLAGQVALPLGVATNYYGAGNSNNKIYVSANSGVLYVYDDDCTLLQTVSAAQTGLTQNVRFVEASTSRIFMQESGSNALISQMLVNSTGHVDVTDNVIYFPLPSVSQITFDSVFTTVNVHNMILFSGFGKLWFPYSGTEREVGILTYGESETPTGTTGVDCDLPENANILICRLGGDGTLGSAGAFVIGNTTQGTGILGIGCSIGLVDCTEDSNPQTNGLGLLIFIASIFVIVGMFYRSLGASATFQLPVFIWVIIIVALSAFFTITGLIDPVFLILSIVAVIALATPKVIGVIQNRGGGFGGGGSTE